MVGDRRIGKSAARRRALELAALAIAFVPFSAAGQDAPRATSLWRFAEPRARSGFRGVEAARPRRSVIVDTAALEQQGRLTLLLPAGDSLVAVRSSLTRPRPGAVVWQGIVEGDSLSSVTLSAVRGTVVGTILTSRGRIYRLGLDETGVPTIRDVDPAGLPDEKDPDSTGLAGAAVVPPCTADDPTRIDVMVVYTGAAREGEGGPEAIEALIHSAIAQANETYLRSGILHRLNLVHFSEVLYEETAGDVGPALVALEGKTDGRMDEIHDLRDTYGADIVVLLLQRDDDECGYANILDAVDPAAESSAFAVVLRDCATASLSFAHEVGHLLWARHDWYDDAHDLKPYAFNHGRLYKQPAAAPTSAWRTLMAVKSECESLGIKDEDCVRLPSWSDPADVHEGVPLGSATEDNVQTLNLTAPTVAAYRCPSPGRTDSWIQDTWSDTGAEPGPVDVPMWKSPDIWVRRAQDAARLNAHRHQNPEAGQPNYVYVKVHNGSNAHGGRIEVFSAHAATSLAWTGGWTSIGSTPSISLAPLETRIVEIPWTPTASGHYCLVAQWQSSPSTDDPMNASPTTDIHEQVRLNNNLAWRNVNIVDLIASSSAQALMSVRNDRPEEATYTLAVVPSDSLRRGTITIELDPKLHAAWRKGGARGGGFDVKGRTLTLPGGRAGRLEGIVLPARFEGPIRLRFERAGKLAVGRPPYVVDVVQTDVGHKVPRLSGGVSYEIRLAPEDR